MPNETARLEGVAVDPGRPAAEEDAWGSGEGIRRGSFTRALRAAAGSDGGASFDPADLLEARPPRDGHSCSITRTLRGVIEEFALGAPEVVLAVSRDPDASASWLAIINATLPALGVGSSSWRAD